MARGRKPHLGNVVPMVADGEEALQRQEDQRQRDRRAAILRLVRKNTPSWLKGELREEYRRVAELLAAPHLDRLKPHYVDTIVEYARVIVRLRDLRSHMPTVNSEVYKSETRNGMQFKNHPFVGQVNEAWRQWRSLVAMLGLSPADERNLLPGQGDLFGDDDEFA